MDVWRITLAALRRWYVLVPLLALTGVAAMFMGDQVDPEYEGRAAAMITPPQALAEIEVANPYGSITGANEALGIVLNSVESRRAVAEQGLPASYEVGVASRSTILQLTTRAGDAEDATAAAQAVLDLAEQELAGRQTESGLPPEAQFTLSILEPPAVTAVVETGATRVQAVVLVLGAAVSLLVAVLFDDIVGLWKRARGKGGRREQKRARAADQAATDQAATAGEPALSTAGATADAGPAAGTEVAAGSTGRDRLPRRRGEADSHSSVPNGNGSRTVGLGTASPSINSAIINTNEWVWPGDQDLEEALSHAEEAQRRRNPFFDPEFTKRQLQKSKRAQTEQPADSEADTSTSSGAAHRP